MHTARDYERYISIKISPTGVPCSCSDCWPGTWAAINQHINPSGPVPHEGDALVIRGDDRFVLESHESGPELLLYLGTATASILLVKSVIDLITTIIKASQSETRSRPSSIRITKRRLVHEETEMEEILEVELPVSQEVTKKLSDRVTKVIERMDSEDSTAGD